MPLKAPVATTDHHIPPPEPLRNRSSDERNLRKLREPSAGQGAASSASGPRTQAMNSSCCRPIGVSWTRRAASSWVSSRTGEPSEVCETLSFQYLSLDRPYHFARACGCWTMTLELSHGVGVHPVCSTRTRIDSVALTHHMEVESTPVQEHMFHFGNKSHTGMKTPAGWVMIAPLLRKPKGTNLSRSIISNHHLITN